MKRGMHGKGGACVVKGGGVHEHHWMSLAGGRWVGPQV